MEAGTKELQLHLIHFLLLISERYNRLLPVLFFLSLQVCKGFTELSHESLTLTSRGRVTAVTTRSPRPDAPIRDEGPTYACMFFHGTSSVSLFYLFPPNFPRRRTPIKPAAP
jgi:hypothetical protein